MIICNDQGDTLSTLVWNAVFDILLHMFASLDLAYADDLNTISSTQEEHLTKIDLVSAFCIFTSLEPAANKIKSALLRFHIIPASIPIAIRDHKWQLLPTLNDNPLAMKYLGVRIPLTLGSTVLDPALHEETARLKALLYRIRHKHAPPGGKMLLIALQIIPRVLYRAARASWSLKQCSPLDTALSAEYRRILSLGPTFPTALLYLPKTMHGFGLHRLSDRIQLHKWNIFHRVYALGNLHRNAAQKLFQNMIIGTPPSSYLASLASWLAPMGISPGVRTEIPSPNPPQFIAPLAPLISRFPLHAVFTDGSVTLPHSSLADLFASPYARKNSANGASAVVLLSSPATWRLHPPLVIRILATATEFPGLNAYVMEVLAQCVALSLSAITAVNLIHSDCQAAINSVSAIIHSQLKRSLGTAPAGVLLASLPLSPNCNVEWVRSHPERREPSRIKWTYADWGIFLADAAAAGEWEHFHTIFGPQAMEERTLTVDLRQIIYELIPMEQCHWIWDSSKLPVIGDLSEARLFLHSLPLYLKTRDEYRAEREGLPPKWASLNISTIRLLPVGSSWKMIKRFCFITYDKYAHGRNRAKGEGDPLCTHCGLPDSLQHILCSCPREELQQLRQLAHSSIDDLLISWRLPNGFSPEEEAMWNRYLSNVENNGPFGDECWLGVFSDEALQWLFHPAFLTLPSPSPFDLIHFFKRWKIVVGLRRKFADSIIMNQQVNCPSLSQNRSNNSPPGRIELPSHRDPQRQHRYPSNFSLLPLPRSCPGLKQFFRSKKPKQPKSSSKFSFPPLIFPPPYKRKRKQRRMEYYFSRIHPPVSPPRFPNSRARLIPSPISM